MASLMNYRLRFGKRGKEGFSTPACLGKDPRSPLSGAPANPTPSPPARPPSHPSARAPFRYPPATCASSHLPRHPPTLGLGLCPIQQPGKGSTLSRGVCRSPSPLGLSPAAPLAIRPKRSPSGRTKLVTRPGPPGPSVAGGRARGAAWQRAAVPRSSRGRDSQSSHDTVGRCGLASQPPRAVMMGAPAHSAR